jgi:hypothetical protein
MVNSCIQLRINKNLQGKQLKTDDLYFLMTKHTQQLQRMQNMIVVQRVGLILIEANDFHGATTPYPMHVIETIGVYLPPVAIEKNERMQRTIRVR